MPAAVPALAFVTVALAALGAVWLRSATSSAWLAACAALLCLGALHYTLRAPLPAARSVARYNGQWVRLEGIVADEPDVRPTHTNLRLKPLRIHTAGVSDEALDDPVLVCVETQDGRKYWSDSEALRSRVRRDYEDWPYGSVVRVEGSLDAPPRMGSFDYREYLVRELVLPPGRDRVTADLEAARQMVHRNAARVVTAADGTTLALGSQVSLTIALRVPARDGQQTIGARLRHGEVNIDLVGDQQAIDYEPRSTLVFLGWAQADVAALKAASPRWVVWTDGIGLPPPLSPSIRTLSLKEMPEAAFISDGQRLISQ